MLVLSRILGQTVIISDNIVVSVFRIKGNRVRLGITAPRNVRIERDDAHPHSEDSLSDSGLVLDDGEADGTMVEQLTRLVLTRKVGESLTIGGNIVVTVLKVKGSRVRLGIDAPKDVNIVRDDAQTMDWTDDETL